MFIVRYAYRMDKQTKVGVGVFVIKDGAFLMGKRLNAHGAGTWSLPGGHLEYGESFDQTARREVDEESGLKVKHIRFGAVTNDYFAQEGKHYVTVWMLCDWRSGEPTIKEPDKMIKFAWRDLNNLPKPLFLPWNNLLQSEFIDNIREQIHKSKNK